MANDMYEFDPIAGSAIDLLRTMPFSAFELSGLPDQKILNTYAENVDALDMTTMSPEISGNYMVDGEFVGTINEENGKLTGIVPYDLDVCKFTNIPFPNRDPIIDVEVPDSLKKLIQSKDKRIQHEMQKYGAFLEQMQKSKVFPLDPKNTLYFARKTLATRDRGTSYLKRILPVWLVEKALIKGSIELSHRRQKSILHITAGNDEWLPDAEWLGKLSKAFRDADSDPLGAIVATRSDINTNEIRDGQSFWKPSEDSEYFMTQKMRGLGISEQLLSGDLSVDATSATITVFLDTLRSFRDYFVKKVYMNKIFLLIAINNGFTKEANKEEITSYDNHDLLSYIREHRLIDGGNGSVVLAEDSHRLTDYILPKIQYHKALRPEGNTELVTMLGTLEEKGLPIPLRIWAAAGGVSIHEIMRSLPDDIVVRNKFAAYKAKLPVDPSKGPGGDLTESSLIEALAEIPTRNKLNRDFSHIKLKDDLSGKELSAYGAKLKNERANKVIVEALSRINSQRNAKIKDEKPINKKYHHVNNRLLSTTFGNTKL